MFRYVACGERDYRRRPVPIYRRPFWELEAVLAGRIAPTRREELRPTFRSRWLWILPPNDPHGWMGDDQPAQVVVFHLSSVPQVLALAAARESGWAIDDTDASILSAWANRLIADRRSPTSHTVLHEARIAAELNLLVTRHLPETPLGDARQHESALVEDALAWLDEHLHEGAGIAGAARAVGISPAHLRRLVHRVKGASPRAMLNGLKLSRASDMLAVSESPLEAVAKGCGYASAAAFCRAHRRASGRTPRGS